jgi:hypothetical protein
VETDGSHLDEGILVALVDTDGALLELDLVAETWLLEAWTVEEWLLIFFSECLCLLTFLQENKTRLPMAAITTRIAYSLSRLPIYT